MGKEGEDWRPFETRGGGVKTIKLVYLPKHVMSRKTLTEKSESMKGTIGRFDYMYINRSSKNNDVVKGIILV